MNRPECTLVSGRHRAQIDSQSCHYLCCRVDALIWHWAAGVVLGVFLFVKDISSTSIGLVIAAGLAGAAAGTVFITFQADRLGRRHTLFILALLTAVGAVPLIFHFRPGGDVGDCFSGHAQRHGRGQKPGICAGTGDDPRIGCRRKAHLGAGLVQRGAGRQRRSGSADRRSSDCGAQIMGR